MIKVGDVVENKERSFDFIRAFPDESLWPSELKNKVFFPIN